MSAPFALGSTPLACAADQAIAFISELSNLPRWAPVFAEKVEPGLPGQAVVVRGDERIEIKVEVSAQTGLVDFLRDGKSTGPRAFARVIGNADNSCSVIMGVPIPPDGDPARVQEIVEDELKALRDLLN